VRLIALARAIVPKRAEYQHGRVVLQLLVQPIPRVLRPPVDSDPVIEQTFNPGGGNSYALPLQLVSYIQFGLPGVGVVGFFLGFFMVGIEGLIRRPQQSLPMLLLGVATAIQVPFLLRTGVPRGLALGALEVFGAYVVARTIIRTRVPSPR
jgi:hypothetical protein